ncbi:MAG: menaquinone biosynthesis protein [Bacteroidales bacterium]|nr:menaquinone biosynthesis protein [Bacteroidales bacterium]
MADKIKISVVSYTNSQPFIFGMNNSKFLQNNCQIYEDMPSLCAQKLLTGKVDIGLVPIAIIPELKHYNIVSNFCIGATSQVKSVLLVSDVPLQKIKTIYLDYQSRTSVLLAQILAKKFWKINIEFLKTEPGFEKKILAKNSASVIIGDRTFNINNQYKYKYDLAEEWIKYTNLPFVFACWVSNKNLDKQFVDNFNNSLKFGIENIQSVINNFKQNHKEFNNFNIDEYFRKNISYNLDENKLKGMELFLDLAKQIE